VHSEQKHQLKLLHHSNHPEISPDTCHVNNFSKHKDTCAGGAPSFALITNAIITTDCAIITKQALVDLDGIQFHSETKKFKCKKNLKKKKKENNNNNINK
jgi:hypothetical protein